MAVLTRRNQVHPRRTEVAGIRLKLIQPTDEQRARAIKLLTTEIDFIPNKSFRNPDAEDEILNGGEPMTFAVSPPITASKSLPRNLPAHLARLCEAGLLTAQQERDLFRRMNYLKFRANVLRATLDPDNLNVELLEEAERLLDNSKRIRDQILKANMRLVVAIVKKFVTPQLPFDEILSDGIMTMMNAVDKFDYDRGFRFSTYAYRSIARSAYYAVIDRQKENSRYTSSTDEILDTEDDRETPLLNETMWESLRGTLSQMLEQLEERERFIVLARFALGDNPQARTFRSLAEELGVSKERVRQLEQRAMAKLRTMATESGMDELVEPAIA